MEDLNVLFTVDDDGSISINFDCLLLDTNEDFTSMIQDRLINTHLCTKVLDVYNRDNVVCVRIGLSTDKEGLPISHLNFFYFQLSEVIYQSHINYVDYLAAKEFFENGTN